MTVDEALAYADDASNIWGPKDASRVLAAEVRRLRAAAEGLRQYLDEVGAMERRLAERHVEGYRWGAHTGGSDTCDNALDRGRELGLWP